MQRQAEDVLFWQWQLELVSSRKSMWIFQLSQTPSDFCTAACVFGSAVLPYLTPGTFGQGQNTVGSQRGWQVTGYSAS